MTNIKSRFHQVISSYHRQFWLMFAGMFISTAGASMIWPFMMIYVSGKLDLPLSQVTVLLTLNAVVSLVASISFGPLIDRFGRKWFMVFSLIFNGVNWFLFGLANSFSGFAVLMIIGGIVNPLYRVAADSMLADLVPPIKRPDAYALIRLSNNIGISIGPAVGGFIAAKSYALSFYFAASGMVFYGLMLAFLAVETIPNKEIVEQSLHHMHESMGGYGKVIKDWVFLSFTAAFTLIQVCATLIWVLLGVYAKTNYNILENQYGFIPMTNALMVVTLQIPLTSKTKKFSALPIIALGGFLYALGVGSVALGTSFWWFWFSMVIITLGEMILVPTSSTFVANMAPSDMRGRYMSVYSITWGIASGIGPVLGGHLNDAIGPKAIWIGGCLVGFTGVIIVLLLALKIRKPTTPAAQPVIVP
jgi:MFS family permease